MAERERVDRRIAEREALKQTAARKRARGKRRRGAEAAPKPNGSAPQDGARRPGPVPVVEFRDVSMVYEGGVVGLERATIRIGRGEFVFLVGPTGCGKSTCVRLLLREVEPAEGEILVSGHDLAEMPRRKVPRLRRNIGTVFQDFKLLPNRTIYANVAYSLEVIGEGRASIRRKVPDILRLVGLSTKLHAYPDEPTGNLDPETSIGIMQLLYRINRTGTTVIVASHDREMVDKMRRRVIELRDGRVVRDQASGLYRPEDESTSEFGVRLRGELGVGVEGHPN
jgi:cell division transport system ATP-binding protein